MRPRRGSPQRAHPSIMQQSSICCGNRPLWTAGYQGGRLRARGVSNRPRIDGCERPGRLGLPAAVLRLPGGKNPLHIHTKPDPAQRPCCRQNFNSFTFHHCRGITRLQSSYWRAELSATSTPSMGTASTTYVRRLGARPADLPPCTAALFALYGVMYVCRGSILPKPCECRVRRPG